MRTYRGHVVETRTLWAGIHTLTIQAQGLATLFGPGQSALVRDATAWDPYLPGTAHFLEAQRDQITFTLGAGDPLVKRTRPGDPVELQAPVGRAIAFPDQARHVLLIGQGSPCSSLLALARHAVAQDRAVVLCALADPSMPAIPPHLWPDPVEYRCDETDLDPELIAWADAIVASGPPDLYRALAARVQAVRYRLERGLVQVLIEPAIPCGNGVCYACAVQTTHGVRLACLDGPAFDLAELALARGG